MEDRSEVFRREGRDWEKVYSRNLDEIPWHSDKPDDEFIEIIEGWKIKPGRVLDVGCGAGTDAIYLASKGSRVTAIDISHEAIGIARGRAEKAGVKVNFIAGDFLEVEFADESFDFINDRGCFHHMNPLRRADFAAKVNRLLKRGGLYCLRCWSDKRERREGSGAAYPISKDVINQTFSRYFKLGEIKDFHFGGTGAEGYICVMRKK